MLNLSGRPVSILKYSVLIFMLLPLSSALVHAQFATVSTIRVGGLPHSVDDMDFNGDGKLDLVVSNSGSDDITVLIGNGNAGFSSSTVSPIAIGNTPVAILSLQIDSDNAPDIVTTNRFGNNVSVFIGDSHGGFNESPQSPIFSGDQPVAIASGDFDNDGDLDLAIVNKDSNDFRILLNTAFGILAQTPPSVFPTGGQEPLSVASGDINNDGNPDLVIAHLVSNDISIFLGDGNGGFSMTADSPIALKGRGSRSIVIGHLNLDRNLDLVIANSYSNDISILLGNGGGRFGEIPISPIAVGTQPVLLIGDDWNSDGRLDLAVANKSSNNVSILLGDIDGTFDEAPDSPVSTGGGPVSLTSGDFNGDSRPDLATANLIGNNVTILINEF